MIKRLINIFRSNQNRELEIPLYEAFSVFTKQLEEKLPGLGIEIEELEEKFEKVKEEHDNQAKINKELENNYETEKQSLEWFDEEVKFLDEIKEEIIERAQNVTTDFTNTYCANITKQLDKLKNDVRKYPHQHERNIDALKRKKDDVGIYISDLYAEKSQINSNISSLQKTLKDYSNSIELRKEFEFRVLLPRIENCQELNDKLNELKNNDGSLEDHEKNNTELSESIEELNKLITNFTDNQKNEPEEPDDGIEGVYEDGDEKEYEVDWPEIGLLGYLGYKVGEKGESEENRHDIIDFVFESHNLPIVNDENYMDRWGEARSEKRLKMLVHSLSGFIRLKENHPDDNSAAISDWEDDLNYIKEEIYDTNDSTFPWPDY